MPEIRESASWSRIPVRHFAEMKLQSIREEGWSSTANRTPISEAEGGANTLSCNGTGDLINNNTSAIFAQNNLWDHLDPDGIDAVGNGAGIIDTTGAGIAAQHYG